jgi:hypothetical protein
VPAFGSADATRAFEPNELIVQQIGQQAAATSEGEQGAGGGATLPVRMVAAGGYHSLLLTDGGVAWSFGCNSHGQLARPIPDAAHMGPRPMRLPLSHATERVVGLAAGLRHSVLLLGSGAVCTYGDHAHGQLGRHEPHRANTCAVFAPSARLHASPTRPPIDDRREPEHEAHTGVGERRGAASGDGAVEGAAAADGATAAARGGVGESTSASAIVAVAAGEVHTLALSASGTLYSWGDNQLHQCARDLLQPLLPTPGVVALPLRAGEYVVGLSAAGYHGAVHTSLGRCLTLGKLIALADAALPDGGGADLAEDLAYSREDEGGGYGEEPEWADDDFEV